MIKNIIFDLGKVLIDYDFNLFFQACGLEPDKIDFKDDISLILKFDSGLIYRKTFYKEMKTSFNFDLIQSDFEKA
ncbi:MAG: hypothetical protein K9N09_02125 [Candidatus Cloacimonetes bacterium]|nr:hypothetical protein [Candidatus Cloacimonadota bacterium]MCF7813404.1 hypothetical protein [Candidatus Cloacimonadota bacterium]MCF7867471.1 hypothetical protein [Candidatus Cloacimonadota bacterium]MCF7883025.1 hypothetical protein [Candidatus Cloacimonadota bacterium]